MMNENQSSIQSLRRGFTIIELMVSLAIISVLMSLLSPALGAAHESARRTACQVHLRTLGQAVQMYRNDHQGALPYALNMYALPVGWTDPIDALAPYIDVDPPHYDDRGRIVSGQPFRCPSDPGHADAYGSSYEYPPRDFMNGTSDGPGSPTAIAKNVTVHIYDTVRWSRPIFYDAGRWHPGGPKRSDNAAIDRNSLHLDGSVGWTAEDRLD